MLILLRRGKAAEVPEPKVNKRKTETEPRKKRQPQKRKPGVKSKDRPDTADKAFFVAGTSGFEYGENEIAKETELLTSSNGPMEIEADENLINLQMFKTIRASLKLTRDVKPSRDDTVPLASFLNRPVVKGRRWTSFVRPSGDSKWLLHLYDHSKPSTRDRSGTKLNFNSRMQISRSGVAERSDAEEIAKTYCKLMERIPFPIHQDVTNRAVYTDICTRHVIPDHDIELLAGAFLNKTMKSGGVEYAAKFKTLDPTTGKTYVTKYQVNTATISLDNPVPALPAYFKTPTFKPSGQAVTQEQKRKERYAFDLAYHINSQMHNAVGSKDAVKAKKHLISQQFISSRHSKVGPFGGQNLYQLAVSTRSRRVLITMSDTVRKSIQNTTGGSESLPTIRINGLSRARANKVVQILTQTWMRTGDIFESWMAACKTADYLNIAGANDDLQGSTCACTPDQRLTECHLCDLCGKIALCQTLAVNASGTALTCDACRSRNPTFLRQNVRNNVHKEYRNLQLSGDRDAEISEILVKLEQNWDEEEQTWNSDYTNTAMSEKLMGKRPRDPFTPSIDGVLPVFHYEQDNTGLRYHAPDNIAVCELFLNQMKEQNPPGVLHFMAEWAKSKKTDADRQRMMAAMNDIHIVRRKIAHTLRRRLKRGPVDINAWEDTKEELLTCKPGSGGTEQSRALRKYHSKAPDKASADFRPRDFERVMQVIAEIEADFADSNKVLQRSADGCPFPFPEEKMPADWCWWSAWATFEERLCRLWLYCNGLWVTFDNIETLFLEAVFSFFNPTDVDPFHLDILSIYYGHPLRFAIARRVPGQGMRTPWTNPRPESLTERGPTNTGNISFEPHMINQTKMEFSAETYDEMVTRTSRIKLSKKYFNPDYKSKSKGKSRASFAEDDEIDMEELEEDFGDDLDEGGNLFEYEDEPEQAMDTTMADDEDDEDQEDEVLEIPESDYDEEGHRLDEDGNRLN